MNDNPSSYTHYARTEGQREVAELLDQGFSGEQISKKLGRDSGNTRSIIRKIKQRSGHRGYSPDHKIDRPVQDGMGMSGLSDMQVNEHGKPIWYKFKADLQRQMEIIQEQAETLSTHYAPYPIIPEPNTAPFNTDVIPWYEIGDGHLGMLAYESVVGHNFDLEIGKRELIHAVLKLIGGSEPCERCVINDLGDMSHFENVSGVTDASGHILDCAATFSDLVEACIQVMQALINAALQRHQNVDVIINQGNHSRTNDLWMARHLRHMYSNNSRVHILDNSSVFIGYRMGRTFVMTHHSDKCKPKDLANVMNTTFKEDWGETEYHYIDIGHIHHGMQLKEHPGVSIESFNQLTPMDKWAFENGYNSRSFLTVIRRSKTYGEQGRDRVTAEEVKDAIAKVAPGTTADNRRAVRTV